MHPLKKYQNKNVAIYGMGITGRSAAKTFKRLKAKVYCWDDNKKIRKKIKKLDLPLSKFWLNKDLVDNLTKDAKDKISDKNLTDHDRYVLNHKLEALKEIRV